MHESAPMQGAALSLVAFGMLGLFRHRSRSLPRPATARGNEQDCIIIVDLQKEFTSGISAIDQTSGACEFPHLADRVSSLLTWARSTNTRIVHIREVDDPIRSVWARWWGEINPGKTALATEGGEAADFSRELPSEKVLHRRPRVSCN
jgi:hypothetical protein